MKRLLLVFTLLFFGFVGIRAQPNSTPPTVAPERGGMILIRVSTSLDSALEAVFYSTRPPIDPTFAHTDINQAMLVNDSLIRSLLGLPKLSSTTGFHHLQLRPFIPTHSVAFEDIRQRSNPQLFALLSYSVSNANDKVASKNALLQSSESKIAHWFMLMYSDSMSGDQAVSMVRKSPQVLEAEPKYIRGPLAVPTFVPNDSLVSQQYALSLMNCFQAWAVVRCDTTMIIGDVDDGTDWTQEDLDSSIFLNYGEIGIDKNGLDKRSNGIDDDSNGFIDDWHGWDFAGSNDYTPDNDARPGDNEPEGDHGTHTAGILSATGNNHIGVAGVAFGSRVIPIKTSCDVCNSLDFGFEGMIYAADMHAKIASCSWGGPGRSNAEQDIIDYVYAKDCAVIAAAGNNGDGNAYQYFYPASYNHVLSVAAVETNGNTVSFSNYNTQVDISAPGWYVLSTIRDNQYETMSGTSMACPDAAGVVALVRQRFPQFTAGQAMQQVRVTGNPIGATWDDVSGAVTVDDPIRTYYEGHGAVNAYRAVTDTSTFAARVDTFSMLDPNKTGSFSPGETGAIVIRALNYLKPLLNLKAQLQIVNGGNYISLGQTTIPFGAVGTLDTISNLAAAFPVMIADSVPPNTQVLIRVIFYDSSVGYDSVGGFAGDYDYISFIVNPSYLDIDANNLTVTFSSIGSVGYNDVLNNTEGNGFLWRNAPDSISLFGRQLLYEGGLMAGVDSNHVVDVVVGADGQTPDEDLEASSPIHYVTPPDHVNAAQELTFSLTDGLADPSVAIGLGATCQAYAFTQGLAANAVVVRYVFRALPGGLLATSNDAAAAFFFDWDIGPSGGDNVTEFDSLTSTAISYRIDPNFPYLGMKLLSAVPLGASLNYHAIMNDGSQGDIDLYSAYTRQEKWSSMNDFYSPAGPGDISHTFGLKNMPMQSDDSVEMTVVIALAENQSLLDQTIDQTTALWENNSDVSNSPVVPNALTMEVYPNPFQQTLHIGWNADGPATITIYDAIGRVVVSQSVSGSVYDFTPHGFASGLYLVDVAVSGTHIRREVIAEP